MKEEFFKKANEFYKKFKRQAKIKDLKYVAQLSQTQDDEEPIFAVQFTNVADQLAPVTFVGKTAEECCEKLEKFMKVADYDFVEMKYHEAQAYHANETAKRHLKIVEDIKARIDKEEEK